MDGDRKDGRKEKNTSRNLCNRNGMVFFTALAVMVILMGIGLSYLYVARSEILISGNEIQALRAFYLAEAGVEHAMAELLYGTGSDGDGIIGYVGLPDLYGENMLSYQAAMPDSKTITGTGQANSLRRDVQVKINNSGFAGAMLAYGADFQPLNVSGRVNGNVDSGTVVDFPSSGINVVGAVRTLILPIDDFIPFFDFSNPNNYYLVNADRTIPGGASYTYTYFNANPPTTTGIYYVSGNFTLRGPNPININGTLVVDGDLFLGAGALAPPSSITVTPYLPNYPAVIVKGYLKRNTTSTGSCDLILHGLVYAGTRIQWDYASAITIDGALVSRNQPLEIFKTAGPPTTLTVTYNPDLQAPGFTGAKAGIPQIVSWQGHL